MTTVSDAIRPPSRKRIFHFWVVRCRVSLSYIVLYTLCTLITLPERLIWLRVVGRAPAFAVPHTSACWDSRGCTLASQSCSGSSVGALPLVGSSEPSMRETIDRID